MNLGELSCVLGSPSCQCGGASDRNCTALLRHCAASHLSSAEPGKVALCLFLSSWHVSSVLGTASLEASSSRAFLRWHQFSVCSPLIVYWLLLLRISAKLAFRKEQRVNIQSGRSSISKRLWTLSVEGVALDLYSAKLCCPLRAAPGW